MSSTPGYELRAVAEGDGAFLLNLYGLSRPDAVLLAAWPHDQREAFLRGQLELQRQHYEATFPAAVHQIVTVARAPAGRLWVGWQVDAARLLDIALLPEHRSVGLGSQILTEVQTQARKRGIPVTLHVDHLNVAARRFYERHGFRAVGDTGTHALLEWGHSAS